MMRFAVPTVLAALVLSTSFGYVAASAAPQQPKLAPAVPAKSLSALMQERRALLQQMEAEIKVRQQAGALSGEDVLRETMVLRRAALDFETSHARRVALRQEIVEMNDVLLQTLEARRRAGVDGDEAEYAKARLAQLDARIELEREKQTAVSVRR